MATAQPPAPRPAAVALLALAETALWPRVLAGDATAAESVRRCIDRRATLAGLNGPPEGSISMY